MSKIQQTQQTHAQTAAKANKPQQQQHHSLSSAQMLESPEAMRSEDVLAAQQTVGNQVVQRALDKDDRRKGLTDEQGNLRQEITSQIQQKRGGGSPLPETIQKEASKKLGRNFKDVRIHTDETADTLSRTISARAFTIGKDIFFKNGVFAPGSGAGRETLMHELTHVVQQGGKGGASGALKLGGPDTAHEKEADRIGKKHAASVGAAPAGAVQREGEEDELQMQSAPEEEELLQMQGEEDELQMQEDEEELQMQEDEEELQMQGEEDELQMQPDSGNTIQRKWELGDDGKTWKKSAPKAPSLPPIPQKPVPQAPKMTPKMQLESVSQAAEKLHPGPQKIAKDKKKAALPKFEDELKAKSKKITKTSAASTAKIEDSGGKELASQRSAATVKKGDHRRSLMNKIQDPKTSPEEAKSAQEKLDMLHKRGKLDTFKTMVKRRSFDGSYAAEAKDARKNNLKEAARSGDEDAYKNMKTESAAQAAEEAEKKKNSKGAKVKGALGSVGGFLKRRLGALDEHVFGKEEEEKKDKDAKSGGGAGGTSEMIAELYQENKKLKAQITELEKAKV